MTGQDKNTIESLTETSEPDNSGGTQTEIQNDGQQYDILCKEFMIEY
jgi:hypothetical protein